MAVTENVAMSVGMVARKLIGCPVGGIVGNMELLVQEHRDVIAGVVRHGQVGLAVAVEVTNRHRIGASACGLEDCWLESAVAVAQQDRDVAVVTRHR